MTFKSTDHVTSKSSIYSAILVVARGVLTFANFSSFVAMGIVLALFGLSGYVVEAWITTERKFYEIYDLIGYFLGYYKVYYILKREAKDNWWIHGNYTTLYPG